MHTPRPADRDRATDPTHLSGGPVAPRRPLDPFDTPESTPRRAALLREREATTARSGLPILGPECAAAAPERAAAAPERAAAAPERRRGRAGLRLPRGRWRWWVAAGVVILTGAAVGSAVAESRGGTSGTFTLSRGQFRTADSGQQLLNGVGAATFSLSDLPTAGGVYLGVDVRTKAGMAYRGKLRVLSDGVLRIGLSKIRSGAELGSGTVPIPGKVSPGQRIRVEVSVTGTTTPVVSARAWLVGEATPGWQYTVTDTGTPAVAAAGTTRVWAYLSTSAGKALTVTFQDVTSRSSSAPPNPTPPTPTPVSPTASASPTITGVPATDVAPPTKSPGSPSGTANSSPSKSTPSPSPTSTGEPPSSGGDRPSEKNTGVPVGTKLTVHKGDITITKAGTVLDSLDVHGFIEVKAPNVTIKRSIVRGGAAMGFKGVVQNNDPKATGLVLQDSEILPSSPTVWLTGVKGANFTMRRVHVHGGVVDGVMASGNNVRVEDSYIHSLVYYAQDPTHSDGSHNDGVQVVGGTNITVTGNTIHVGTRENSVLQVTQDVAATRGLSFTGNWVDGGTCSVKLTEQGGSALGPVIVSGNHFGRSMSIAGCAVLRTKATTLTAVGNRWEDNGQPVVPKVYG